MNFQLDTSGEVFLLRPHPDTGNPTPFGYGFPDLNPFTQGYVEALLGAAGDAIWLRVNGAQDFAFSDLAPETLARIMEDCRQWCDRFGPDWPDAGDGAVFWDERSARRWAAFPPIVVTLNEGKVIFQ